MRVPSGENATAQTDFVCPLNGPAIVLPVCASHTQMVSSSEPETMCMPSGENATSDGQGFAKPQGYVGKGAAGKGQGRDN
jgi:hypothetical protein